MARKYGTGVMAAAAIAIGIILPLVMAEVVLRFLPVLSGLYQSPVTASHPVGQFEPNERFTYSIGSRFDLVVRGRTNNLGWVNDQDYDSTATSPLLAVIGDSYVEALMVPYAETLQGRLAAMVGGRARVYSFGASGSPLAQYLVLADYARRTFHPARAVVVVVGNDFDESLRKYKVAPGLHGFVEDSAGQLVLQREDYQPSRLKRFLRKSALVRYLVLNVKVGALLQRQPAPAATRGGEPAFAGNVAAQADSQRVADSRRATDRFLADLPARVGLAPACIAVVVDGVRPQLYDARTRAAGDSSYFGQMRAYLMAGARRAGYAVVDLQPEFIAQHAATGRTFEYANDGHWNGLGHGIAAQAVARTPVFATLPAAPSTPCTATSGERRQP